MSNFGSLVILFWLPKLAIPVVNLLQLDYMRCFCIDGGEFWKNKTWVLCRIGCKVGIFKNGHFGSFLQFWFLAKNWGLTKLRFFSMTLTTWISWILLLLSYLNYLKLNLKILWCGDPHILDLRLVGCRSTYVGYYLILM